MTKPTQAHGAMPELPKPEVSTGSYAGPAGEGASENLYTADQMREYARAAIQQAAGAAAPQPDTGDSVHLGGGKCGGANAWRPIKTAPRDGSYALVTSTHNPFLRGVVQYLDGQWIDWNDNDQTRLIEQAATHCMPLPPHPAPRPDAPTSQINPGSAPREDGEATAPAGEGGAS